MAEEAQTRLDVFRHLSGLTIRFRLTASFCSMFRPTLDRRINGAFQALPCVDVFAGSRKYGRVANMPPGTSRARNPTLDEMGPGREIVPYRPNAPVPRPKAGKGGTHAWGRKR